MKNALTMEEIRRRFDFEWVLKASTQKLLAEKDDFCLCNGIFLRIVQHHGDDINALRLNAAERVVLLVWNTFGIVGNGGFRYLFEGNFKGDPYFALTARAFRAIGCTGAADAIARTLAIFPNSRPYRDKRQRLQYYLSRITEPTDTELQFWDAEHHLKKCLANFIRAHADSFLHLHGGVRRPKQRTTMRIGRRANRGPTLSDLPHWGRVAFAARCAQRVFHLLAGHWPDIPTRRSNAVRDAINLVERSAAQGRALNQLNHAAIQAVRTAGAALVSRSSLAQSESRPANAYTGTIASFVAKAAEKAVESALAQADRSLLPVMEAWDYASSAAQSAGEENIAEGLEEDFLKLHRTAMAGKWTDKSKIPSDIWSALR